jgi:hypothetical protein
LTTKAKPARPAGAGRASNSTDASVGADPLLDVEDPEELLPDELPSEEPLPVDPDEAPDEPLE